jgi:hypothetical protein
MWDGGKRKKEENEKEPEPNALMYRSWKEQDKGDDMAPSLLVAQARRKQEPLHWQMKRARTKSSRGKSNSKPRRTQVLRAVRSRPLVAPSRFPCSLFPCALVRRIHTLVGCPLAAGQACSWLPLGPTRQVNSAMCLSYATDPAPAPGLAMQAP